jgi:hypothetical protein
MTIEAGQSPEPHQINPTETFTEIPTIETTSPQAFTETSSPAAEIAAATPTLKPSRTPPPTPTPAIPNAAIQILAPGPASKVTSPIKVTAYLKPAGRGNIRIELLGEDGRLLARKVTMYYPGGWVHVLEEIEFEIPGVAEASRLQISSEDSYGRINALASVGLILLSHGNADINPSGDLSEPIIIQQPAPKAFIQGGKVMVSGIAHPMGKDPLLIEMIGTDGKYIGPSRLVTFGTPGPDGYIPFTAEVPYSVASSTWALLVITDRGDRIPGPTHLSSVEILLSP